MTDEQPGDTFPDRDPAAPDRDPFAAIHPEPGQAVPWPPRPDQRGLSSPYPPGWEDPEPEDARREERFYLKLLLGMVLAIIAGGFTVSLIALALGYGGAS